MDKENKKIQIEKEFEIANENFLTLYSHFFYKNVGRKLLRKPKFNSFFKKKIYNKKYEGILKKANLSILPEEYFITIYLTIISSFVAIIFITFLLLLINSLIAIGFFYIFTILVVILGISLYNYPIVVAKKRAAEINASIPYLLPYMKILSKELNLSKMIDIIGEFLIYPEIKSEFKRIKYYSQFIGYDINSSIRMAMVSCPSSQLSDLMNDLVTISNSGGNIYDYLERKLNNLNEEISALEKKNIETLLIYSQVYVVLLLISPLFFAIMSSILSFVQFGAEQGTSSGSGAIGGIVALIFFLPIAYIGFMMLVYYSKPLYSRLVPIKNENK